MKRTIAFDASPSARTKDENGFLRVAVSHITKECVNPYYGREIPGWQEANLDPHKIYYGYRSGKELEKAAKTFDGLPLLLGHHIESADDPQTEHRVGSLGTDAKWNPPYLDNSLFITDDRGIKAIEDGEAKELSCAYMYDPLFRPGEYDGHHYDFIMTNIRGNHVALVEEGRAGPDVVVADAAITPNPEGTTDMSKLFDKFKGALDGDLEDEEKVEPVVTNEEEPSMGEESETVEDEDKVEKVKALIASVADKLTPEEKEALEAAVTDLAVAPSADEEVVEEKEQEEVMDEEEEPLDASEAVAQAEASQEEEAPVEPEAAPEEEKVEDEEPEPEQEEGPDEYLRGYMSKAADACGMDADDDAFKAAFQEGVKYGLHHAEHHQKEGTEVEPEFKGASDSKLAMDAAIKKVKEESLKHFRALSSAADATRSVLGNIDALAYDSADDIYGAALKKAGVDLKGHPKSAYRSMFAVMGKKTSRVAQDEASTKYSGAFAGLNRIKH